MKRNSIDPVFNKMRVSWDVLPGAGVLSDIQVMVRGARRCRSEAFSACQYLRLRRAFQGMVVWLTDVSFRLVGAVVFMTFVSMGCAAPPKPLLAMQVVLNASPELNPDPEGRPSPVIARIYQLATRDDFDRARFFDLYDRDRDVLGASELARTDIAIHPGEHLDFSRQLDAKTRSIAIMVAFRSIYSARWRAVVDVPEPGVRTLRVALGASSVTLSGEHEKSPGYWSRLGKFVAPVWKEFGGVSSSSK